MIELVECLETRCKGQDNLFQEQRDRIRSLEADHDQVIPAKIRVCEVEQVHDAKGYILSFGGVEAPGSLGLTQAPSMIVPEKVQSASNRAWSAQDDARCTSTQTGLINFSGECLGLCGCWHQRNLEGLPLHLSLKDW